MKTLVFDKINELVVNTIREGGLVAFPTETVYGLGANALNPNAVKKIFLAKGRPQDNPLIIHISNLKQLDELVLEIPDLAVKLIDLFWPGPLTIIFKKNKIVPNEVTCGLDTVAIRMPSNKLALELIEKSNCPIAAPSANVSGRPSPTKAKHVIDDLNGKIDIVIDGGAVNIGLESTVIDLSGELPIILRPGKITRSQIESVIGKVETSTCNVKPKSPGMKYKHYSPKAKVIIYSNNLIELKKKYVNYKVLKYESKVEMANKIFNDFRECDDAGIDVILVKSVDEKGLGLAIMNRVKKAASDNV